MATVYAYRHRNARHYRSDFPQSEHGMNLEDFLRLHSVRAPNVAWFLGAGASAAAGIPTAYDMIWDFKRTIYCAAQRVSLETCADLSSAIVRARLQKHFDDAGSFPPQDGESEYADYFEAAYGDEVDRRSYLDRQMEGASPSFGHFALAALMRADRVRVVWTPNFDRMIEDAAYKVYGTTTKLVTATLDAPELAIDAMNEGRWPLLGKLHGDFHSRRLKNIREEVRSQDAQLRQALIDCCRRFGLAVVGYSGRDASLMEALTEAIDDGGGYPQGLYWFHCGEDEPLPRVRTLLDTAAAAGVRTALVGSETFDELMGDLLVLEQDLPGDVASLIAEKRRRRVTSVPIPDRGNSFPVIRLNALPVVSWPQTARLVECKIGGTREVRNAVRESGADVLAARRAAGVIAFGADIEVRKAFSAFDIRRFDLYPIVPGRLRYWDSAELGLLYEALARALARDLPLQVERRRREHRLLVDPTSVGDDRLQPLLSVVRSLVGTVGPGEQTWVEAVGLRLVYRFNQVWLLLEPMVALEYRPDEPPGDDAKEFVRNRLAGRYNSDWNRLLDAWRTILLCGEVEREVRTFVIAEGVDAVFTVGPVTAFSRRVA